MVAKSAERTGLKRPGSDWRQRIQSDWGITTLEGSSPAPKGALWATRCCKIKGEKGGQPLALYRAPLPQAFMGQMEKRGLPYAIVSDLYGLHFSDEWRPAYDTHPSQLDGDTKRALGHSIGSSARERGFRAIVFYNNSPVMSRPYFEMLSHSALAIYFTTRLAT